MISLDPELWKIFWVLALSKVSSCPKNGSTFANVLKEKMENLNKDQKVELVIRLFSDNCPKKLDETIEIK